MMKHGVLVLFSSLLSFSYFSCELVYCPLKDCVCAWQAIHCEHLHFDAVPDLVDEEYKEYQLLYLQGNSIGSIPDNAFPANLTYLDLRYNEIENISDSAFDQSASTLQILLFSNTKFARVPDALLNLTALRTLEFKNTEILDWNIDVMKHLGKTLQNLYLYNCRIMAFPDWMQHFPILTTLASDSNILEPIPNDAFDVMNLTLKTLQLTGANLSHVPLAISKLRALEFLNLEKNHLAFLENLPSASKIRNLNLQRNEISDVSNFDFELIPFSYTLEYLDLYWNKVPHIPNLFTMKVLKSLDLRFNDISDPISGFFPPSLETLYLNSNKLVFIPNGIGALSQLENLEITYNQLKNFSSKDLPNHLICFDIHSNQLTELHNDLFHENSTLRELKIGSYPIKNVAPAAFKNLVNLKYLDLQFTKILRVPEAITDLKNLTNLDLRRNLDLHCSCNETELFTWFQSNPNLNAKGRCGLAEGGMQIFEYFTSNATDCS